MSAWGTSDDKIVPQLGPISPPEADIKMVSHLFSFSPCQQTWISIGRFQRGRGSLLVIAARRARRFLRQLRGNDGKSSLLRQPSFAARIANVISPSAM